jgi:putative transposase
MPKQTTPIQLTTDEIAYLNKYINSGKRSARAIKRAQILLHSHAGKTPEQICEIVNTSVSTVYLTRQHYRMEGVQAAIEEKPRSGQPRRLNSEHEAALTVLACSEAPEGHAQWSVRLLTDKAIEIGIVEQVGRETIRRFLKKMRSNRGSRNAGVLDTPMVST